MNRSKERSSHNQKMDGFEYEYSYENVRINESLNNFEEDDNAPLFATMNQNVTLWDCVQLGILLMNHMTAQWMAYMVVYANPGDTKYTSLELDLQLTQTEYGVLSGVTYALVSGVFALFSGLIVDRYSRKFTLVIAGLLWGSLTFLQSYSVSFMTILIPRILMEI